MSRVVRGCFGGGVDELRRFKLDWRQHLAGQAVTCQAPIKAATAVEVNVRDAQWETREWPNSNWKYRYIYRPYGSPLSIGSLLLTSEL
jgi:hypothetical protein